MHNLHIPVGRVYHTNGLDHWVWDEDESARYAMSNRLYEAIKTEPAVERHCMSASAAHDQIKFELDAYERQRGRVDDPKAEMYARLNQEYGWWDDYTRGEKRYHGARQRGPVGPVQFHTGGPVYHWPRIKNSPSCWKSQRLYQARDRRRGQAW